MLIINKSMERAILLENFDAIDVCDKCILAKKINTEMSNQETVMGIVIYKNDNKDKVNEVFEKITKGYMFDLKCIEI